MSQAFIAGSGAEKQAASGKAQIRTDGLGLKADSAKARVQAEAPLAGYKTVNKYSLQMTEAARESVFKQIAIRLNPEGGEFLMRLDPPELGKLNLQMTVENHGQMRLLITAERSDLASLLERHMAELEQELAKQGITVTGSEVRHDDGKGTAETKDNSGSDFALNGENAANEDDSQQSQTHLIRPGVGFITADSLDFWA
ncbi:MAG: flagellar hook-length control protein FliK [Planctomycetota bacterium]|jgi:flagellar hook-length control protein FliK